MEIIRRNVQRNYKRNHDIVALGGLGSVKGGITDLPPLNFLPAFQNNDGSYTVDVSRVNFKGSVVSDKEISAFGLGTGGEETGSVVVYDGLDSTDPKIALSANQGRILNEKIGKGGTKDYNQLTNKPCLNNVELTSSTQLKTINKQSLLGSGDITIEGSGGGDGHTHENKDVLDLITSTKVSNWDTAFTNNHSHSNKSVLDGIKNSDISNWNGKLDKSVWDQAFYFDANNNIHAKVNVIGDKEVSAYGMGSGSEGGGGSITIVDSLLSYSTTSALSANQGRVLKELIDTKEGVSDYSKLTNKPCLNSVVLTPTTKLKTINNQSLLGAGNITIQASGGGDGHTHSNKGTLDGITSTKVSHWDTAYNNSHSHSNKTTLDGITSNDVSNWDTAWNNEHTHSNKGTLDGITSTKVSHWDTAWNNEHTHSNKGTLDGIKSTDITNWNGKVDRSGDTMSGTLTINADVKPNNVVVKSGGSIYGGSTELMMCSTTGMTIYQDMDGDGYWNISSVGEAYFNGNVLSDGEITAYSDRRKKSNIKPLENRGYIQPVTYTKDGKQSIGFIAQDVQKLYPELVIEDNSKEKYLSLNYQQYTAVLQAQIIELKKEIEELKNKLN